MVGLPGDPRGTLRVRARSQQLCRRARSRQLCRQPLPGRAEAHAGEDATACAVSDAGTHRGSVSRAESLALVWFSLSSCLYKQLLLVKRHHVWVEPMQTSSFIVVKQKVLYLIPSWQMDWPKSDSSALGSADALLNCRGCRLVFTYCERMSFWHLCLKREEERGKFSFTVYTILITKFFCTLHFLSLHYLHPLPPESGSLNTI